MSQGQNLLYYANCLVTIHTKYKSSIYYGFEVMAKVKVFQATDAETRVF